MRGKVFFSTEKSKKGYNNNMRSRAFLRVFLFFSFTATFILVNGSLTDAISKDPIEITRDENKTAYSIGSSEKKGNEKTEEEKDKERAWDMLRNMNTVIDKQGQGGKQNGQRGGK
jgi:hypothetical protein